MSFKLEIFQKSDTFHGLFKFYNFGKVYVCSSLSKFIAGALIPSLHHKLTIKNPKYSYYASNFTENVILQAKWREAK